MQPSLWMTRAVTSKLDILQVQASGDGEDKIRPLDREMMRKTEVGRTTLTGWMNECYDDDSLQLQQQDSGLRDGIWWGWDLVILLHFDWGGRPAWQCADRNCWIWNGWDCAVVVCAVVSFAPWSRRPDTWHLVASLSTAFWQLQDVLAFAFRPLLHEVMITKIFGWDKMNGSVGKSCSMRRW